MSAFASTLSKHRRLTILKFLRDSPGYTSNASILAEICNGFGVSSTRDQIAGDVAWLADQGLVSYEDQSGFIIVTASEAGIDLANGKAHNPGVQRPRPGV